MARSITTVASSTVLPIVGCFAPFWSKV